MYPRSRISSALNSSLRKSVERRGSQASVASAPTIGRTPVNRPKFDSMPQTAMMTCGGTAVALVDPLQEIGVAGGHLPAVADDRRARLPRDVGFERQHGFRLRAIALEHHRQRLVDRGERLVDGFLAEPARDRFDAQFGEPFGERRSRLFLTAGVGCVGGCAAGGEGSATRA